MKSFTVTSVIGYVDYELDALTDLDGAGIEIFRGDQKEDYDQFSQELRFTSRGGGGDAACATSAWSRPGAECQLRVAMLKPFACAM